MGENEHLQMRLFAGLIALLLASATPPPTSNNSTLGVQDFENATDVSTDVAISASFENQTSQPTSVVMGTDSQENYTTSPAAADNAPSSTATPASRGVVAQQQADNSTLTAVPATGVSSTVAASPDEAERRTAPTTGLTQQSSTTSAPTVASTPPPAKDSAPGSSPAPDGAILQPESEAQPPQPKEHPTPVLPRPTADGEPSSRATTAESSWFSSTISTLWPQLSRDHNTPASADVTASSVRNASTSIGVATSFEDTAEHNAILDGDQESYTDRPSGIVVGHKCTRIFQDSVLWNVTDGGMLALKSCPPGYQGNMYRPCFSSGKWGNVDYSECRLEHLGRMRHMIFHQVQKGMVGNMYVLADEFATYLSSVDMKSPMDRLEAFEILNTFLKLDMTLKMDKSKDIKYTETLLNAANELIKKKTVLFSPGSQKNKLITEKVVEMIFDLTSFAEKALRGLLKTQTKQRAFRSASNVVLYLYRGKLSRQFPPANFSSELEREEELSSHFVLEKTLERSAYALIWIKGVHNLLSTDTLLVNSDVAVATILSPLNSLNHLMHPPTFDIGLRLKKEIPMGYRLKCGQLWNVSHLWNLDDCRKALRKEDIVTCRCHHLGSISLLLEELPHDTSMDSAPPIGKTITVSCVTSLSLTVLTLVVNFLIKRRDNSLSIFILINLLVCLAAIQIVFMVGINKTERFEVCLSFAVLLHYLFLVSCFWVVSYSVYLLNRLRTCMEYVGRVRDYCAACWLLPTLLLIISFMGNPNGYETKQFCWLNLQKGIVWSFVVPVTGLIIVNTIVMIMALKTFNEQMSMTHRVEICKTRNSMRAGITLLPFFAINWFFGILAVENADNLLLQIVFSFTNSLQGLLTFLFFAVMDNNVQMMFRLKFHEASRKPKVSAMRMRKSGSFPILERPLMTLTDDCRRNDCTPLLSHRTTYGDTQDDPCCSNIRV